MNLLLATFLGLSVLFTCIHAEVHYHEFVVSAHSYKCSFILFCILISSSSFLNVTCFR